MHMTWGSGPPMPVSKVKFQDRDRTQQKAILECARGQAGRQAGRAPEHTAVIFIPTVHSGSPRSPAASEGVTSGGLPVCGGGGVLDGWPHAQCQEGI